MRRLILITGFIMAVGSATPAFAQPVYVSLDHVPKREFGAAVSLWGWSKSEGEAGSVAGRYSRNLNDHLALEAAFDVGGMHGRAFTLPSVQVRWRNAARPASGPFFTMGLARGFADRDLDWVPRGRLLTFGGGVQGPITGDLALRFDLQVMVDDHSRGAIRLMVGILGGRD
jgi:hypothetical protein